MLFAVSASPVETAYQSQRENELFHGERRAQHAVCIEISRFWRSWLFLVVFFLRVTFPKNHKNRQEELLVSQHNFLAFFFQCGIFSRKKKKVEARSEKKNKIPRSKFSQKILPYQERKLASQDIFLAFFLSTDFFLGFLYLPWPTNLAILSWLFWLFFFSHQERENPTCGAPHKDVLKFVGNSKITL